MSDTELKIEITVDVSVVESAVAQAKTSIEGMGGSVEGAKSHFAAMRDEIENWSSRIAHGASEGVSHIKEFASGAAGIVGSVVSAGQKVYEFAGSIAKTAQENQKLAQSCGISAGQVQQLRGISAATGTSVDTLAKGLGQMGNGALAASGHSAAVAAALKSVGVSANDGRTNMERVVAVADKFKEMPDGPQKTALAVKMFGDAGKDLVPVLNMGSKALGDLNTESATFSGVSASAQQKAEALGGSIAVSKVAWQGLQTILTDALAPVLKELIDGFNSLVGWMAQSYQSGGAMKTVFEAVQAIFHGVMEVVQSVADALSFFFTSTSQGGVDWKAVIQTVIDAVVAVIQFLIKVAVAMAEGLVIAFKEIVGHALDWKANFVETFGAVGIAIDYLGGLFKVFAKVVQDTLTFHWGSIASDWRDGMKQLDTVVNQEGAKLVADTKRIRDEAQKNLREAGQMNSDLQHYVQGKPGKPAKSSNQPSGGGGQTGGSSGDGGGAGGGSSGGGSQHRGGAGGAGGAQKDDIVQHLEDELKARQDGWNREQDAQGTAHAYSLQSIADYWKQALAATNLSANDRRAVQEKYHAANQALIDQDTEKYLAAERDKIEAAKGNYDAQLQIAQQAATDMAHRYGEESQQAKAAAQQVTQIERAKADELKQIREQDDQADLQRKEGQIQAEDDAAKFRVQMGQEKDAQLLAQEAAFENRRFEMEKADLQRRMALDGVSAADKNKLRIQIEQLEQQHQQKLTQLDQQGILQRTKLERDAINSIASSWSQAIGKMVTLQASFASTIKSLWQGLQQAIGNAISSIIQNWLDQQLSALLLGGTKQKTASGAQIADNAAAAAAGAYSATAAIPFVGPQLAPEAASTAYGGAMGWLGALAVSPFDVGAWNLSKDQLAFVHSGEMIIPAAEASGMRAMISTFAGWSLPAKMNSPLASLTAANTNAPVAANDGSGRGGDVHLHLHGDIIHNPAQLEAWFKKNAPAVGAGVRQYVRNGGSTTR